MKFLRVASVLFRYLTVKLEIFLGSVRSAEDQSQRVIDEKSNDETL